MQTQGPAMWFGSDFTKITPEEGTRLAGELREKIRPLLAGHHPMVQAAALAELIAMNLAGHHASIRDDIHDHHKALVELLVPDYAEAIWGNIPEGKGNA